MISRISWYFDSRISPSNTRWSYFILSSLGWVDWPALREIIVISTFRNIFGTRKLPTWFLLLAHTKFCLPINPPYSPLHWYTWSLDSIHHPPPPSIIILIWSTDLMIYSLPPPPFPFTSILVDVPYWTERVLGIGSSIESPPSPPPLIIPLWKMTCIEVRYNYRPQAPSIILLIWSIDWMISSFSPPSTPLHIPLW